MADESNDQLGPDDFRGRPARGRRMMRADTPHTSVYTGGNLLAVLFSLSIASKCPSQAFRLHYVAQQVFDYGMRGEDWCVSGDLLAHDGVVVMVAIDQALATATRVLCRAIREEDDDFASTILWGSGLRPLSQPLSRAIAETVYQRVRESDDSRRSLVSGLLAIFEQAHGPAAEGQQGVLQWAMNEARMPDACLLLPTAQDYLAIWHFPKPGAAIPLLKGRDLVRSAIERVRAGIATDRDSVRSDLWRVIMACEAGMRITPVRGVAALDTEVRTQNLLGLVLLMRAIDRHELATLRDVGVSELGGRQAQHIFCRTTEGELDAMANFGARVGKFLEAYREWVTLCLRNNPESSDYEHHLREAGNAIERRLTDLRAHSDSVTRLLQSYNRHRAEYYVAPESDPLLESLRRWQVGVLGLEGGSMDSALTGSRDRANQPFRESVGMPYIAGAVLVSVGQSTVRRYVLPVYLPGSQSTLLESWAGVSAMPPPWK